MRVAITFPPLESKKGVPLLTQNRQFQWFNEPTYIFPVIPAYAATMLKEKGFDVLFLDGIAKGLTSDQWISKLKEFRPDLIAIETKTPVIQLHWKIIDKLKAELPDSKVVLIGDHVTALPKESLQNSKVDFVLTGGDFDFLLVNLAQHLNNKKVKLEPGIYYRKGKKIVSTGKFSLKHSLSTLPFIDRELVEWKNYAYKNGNFKKTPGTYTMAGRDCWWHQCKFCFPPETKVFTDNGIIDIQDVGELFDSRKIKALNLNGSFETIHNHYCTIYSGDVLKIKPHKTFEALTCTPNHPIMVLRAGKNVPVRADELTKDDWVLIPKIKGVNDIKKIDLQQYYEKNPLLIKRSLKVPNKTANRIFELSEGGWAQRKISRELNIDRQTISRYLKHKKEGTLEYFNPLKFNENEVSVQGSNKKIKKTVSFDKDLSLLLGYYLAEGHVFFLKNRPNSSLVCFTFSKKERGHINRVKRIFSEKFGVNIIEIKNEKNNTVQLTCSSSIIANFFAQYGKGCLEKRLPNNYLLLPMEKQRGIVKGLFYGDGCLRLRKGSGSEYILSTVSKELAYQVVEMLKRMNIMPSCRIVETEKRKKSKHDTYIITLNQSAVESIFHIKCPKREYLRSKEKIINDNIYLQINRIERKGYSGPVYNLHLPETHSYNAGQIAVANCSWTTIFPVYRTQNPIKVVNEIEMLVKRYGIKEIMDDSGTFPVGKWLEIFCNEMIKRGLNKKVIIDCNMRAKALTQDEYNLMAKAGFRFILYGFESGSQATLDKINKGIRVQDLIDAVRMAKKAGLQPHITAMIGYPWETKEEAQKTIQIAKMLFDEGSVDTLQATILIPYPGTPLYKECLKNGWLRTKNYADFDQRQMVMNSPMTEADVKELTQALYKVFFSPKYIVRKIAGIRSTSDLKFMTYGVKKVIGHLADFRKRNEVS